MMNLLRPRDLPPDAAPEAIEARLEATRRILWETPLDDVLTVLDELGRRIPLSPRLRAVEGAAYLGLWLRRSALLDLVSRSLGDPRALDGVVATTGGRSIATAPRGIVAHWTAGNVPTLAVFSLVQGWLSKNANIVKVPDSAADLMAEILDLVSEIEVDVAGRTIRGSVLSDAAVLVSFPSSDERANRDLSRLADVRVIWGGERAVEAILALPRREAAEDLVFGPKYSFAVADASATEGEGVRTLARRVATDAVVFDQTGCSSPHVLFVEGGEAALRRTAEALAEAFAGLTARFPRPPLDPGAAVDVIAARARHALDPDRDLIAPRGSEWTVLIGRDLRLEEPVFHRVLFVKSIDRIERAATLVTRNVQTIGLAVADPDRRRAFAREAAYAGAARCVPLGTMNNFDAPWDGMYPLDRLVRRTALKEE